MSTTEVQSRTIVEQVRTPEGVAFFATDADRFDEEVRSEGGDEQARRRIVRDVALEAMEGWGFDWHVAVLLNVVEDLSSRLEGDQSEDGRLWRRRLDRIEKVLELR